MSIFDYSITDLLFSHWLRRKVELQREGQWRDDLRCRLIDARLDAIRPIRNPTASIFITAGRWD